MMNRELHTRQHHAANTTAATTDPSSQVGMWCCDAVKGRESVPSPCVHQLELLKLVKYSFVLV